FQADSASGHLTGSVRAGVIVLAPKARTSTSSLGQRPTALKARFTPGVSSLRLEDHQMKLNRAFSACQRGYSICWGDAPGFDMRQRLWRFQRNLWISMISRRGHGETSTAARILRVRQNSFRKI